MGLMHKCCFTLLQFTTVSANLFQIELWFYCVVSCTYSGRSRTQCSDSGTHKHTNVFTNFLFLWCSEKCLSILLLQHKCCDKSLGWSYDGKSLLIKFTMIFCKWSVWMKALNKESSPCKHNTSVILLRFSRFSFQSMKNQILHAKFVYGQYWSTEMTLI